MFAAMKRFAEPSGGAAAPSMECPPFREELGRGSWALMHTLAAHFPTAPTAYERAHAAGFFAALAALYPCSYCRDDFAASVAAEPPCVESRAALTAWLCRQHNQVNAKLGKPAFPCTAEALEQRWRRGGPGCGEAQDSLGHDSAVS